MFSSKLPVTLALGLSALTTSPALSWAQETPSPPVTPPSSEGSARAAADANQLGEIVNEAAAEQRRGRRWVSMGALAAGAAGLSAGLYAWNREGRHSDVGPVVTFAGGAMALTGALWLFLPLDPAERLARHFEERRPANVPAAQVVSETENEWHEMAIVSRALRKTWGPVGIVVGGLLLAGGAVSLFVPADSGDFSEKQQRGSAAVMMGVGAWNLIAGIETTLVRSPIERSYDLYRRLKQPPTATSVRPWPRVAR